MSLETMAGYYEQGLAEVQSLASGIVAQLYNLLPERVCVTCGNRVVNIYLYALGLYKSFVLNASNKFYREEGGRIARNNIA